MKTQIGAMVCAVISVAFFGCADGVDERALDGDASAVDDGGAPTATAEAQSTSTPTTDAIGAFHLIRLSNTQLCLQPLGGSAGDVIVELHQCNASAPAQNWLFVQKATSEFEIVNQQSGKCLYVNGGATSNVTLTHSDCNIFGTNTPASNALWKPSSLTGFASLMSRIQHRDSKLCADTFGNAFDGIGLRTFGCNGTPQQTFVVGLE
jgi:ricin-type beta-trefoil lectin protein